MIGELVGLGSRLAGKRDPRLARGLWLALGEAVAIAIPYALVVVFVRRALEGTLSHALLWQLTLGVLAALALRLLFARPAMVDIFSAAHSLMGHARIRMADRLRRLPMGFFSERRIGELAGVLTTDIALVEDIWSHLFGVFAASLVLPLVVGAGLCVVDWRLGLAVFFTMPIALVVLRVTSPIFTRHVGAVLDASADANARIVEYVQGIAVLRTFGRHGDGYERLRASMERLRDAMIRADVAPTPLLSVYTFTVEASLVLVALLGSWLMLGGTLTAPTLLVFLMVTGGLTRQLSDLGVAFLLLRAAERALERIDGLLAEPPLADPKRKKKVEVARHDIELDDVTFTYGGGGNVLEHVSLRFPERTLTALVGPSGAGKSTIAHLVARLWDVPAGSGAVRIGGVDVRDLSFEDLHRHIAMVFQDVVLFSGTVLENIRVGKPDASYEEVVAAAKAAHVHDFVADLPLAYDTPVGEGGSALSGGQRQRISIARAILKDAPVVLLDEATASVDATAEAEIQRAIDELVKHKTVVVIAHRLRTIRRAHRIVVLEAGKVVEEGTHAELVDRDGLYARLWAAQERARGWRLATQDASAIQDALGGPSATPSRSP
ncbi:MAG: ABC transporter ATP-binding protein [Labilithrix sp.]|nr:ABC transporter ATP-binding protein [Labilithrix sp.]MCW5818115.1 ABC transporter ATP-binding protein [Labilithrix sp.]